MKKRAYFPVLLTLIFLVCFKGVAANSYDMNSKVIATKNDEENVVNVTAKPTLCGKYDGAKTHYISTSIDDNFVYAANHMDGVQKIDFSIDASPVLVASNDIATGKLSTYQVIKDENYLYSVSRTQGGTPISSPLVYINSNSGDCDLSDGGDGWDKGTKTKTTTYIVGNSESCPVGGPYGSKLGWTANWGYNSVTCKKTITGGVNNYASFWIKVGTPTAEDNDTVRFNVFEGSSNSKVYQLYLTHKKASNNFTIKIGISDNKNTIITVNGGSLSYNKWYLIKCNYKIDTTAGGGTLQYKENITDSWKTLCSKLDINTDGKTPTSLTLGATKISTTYKAGAINFDEVYFDTVDLDTTIDDEGRLDCLNASDLSIVDTVWLNWKCNNIVKYDKWLVMSMQKGGLAIFDATVPSKLKFLGHYLPSGKNQEYHGLAVYKNGSNIYAYVAGYFSGLIVLDITNPTNIKQISTTDFAKNSEASLWDVVLEYPYLYGTKNLNTGRDVGGVGDKRGLVIYDVSNPKSPIIYDYELPADNKDVFMIGDGDVRPLLITKLDNYAYLANGSAGVAIFDVTDPTKAFYDGKISFDDDVSIGTIASDNKTGRIFVGAGCHKAKSKPLYLFRK